MDKQRTATSTLRQLVVWGIVLGLVGGFVVAMTWPSTEVSLPGDIEETGSAGGLAIGAVLGWIGNAMLLVGLVGFGVKYGREASPSVRTAADA